jgi:la-related protein 1
LDTDSKINGELKSSTSVVFGTIDDTAQPLATTAEVEPNTNLEKGFKSLAIGVKATDPSIKPRKSNKPIKNDGDEKEHHHHHHHHQHHAKIVNGDIALDPLLAKKAESGETKWKFGNEGLVSPAGGSAIDIETKPAAGAISLLFLVKHYSSCRRRLTSLCSHRKGEDDRKGG